MDCFKQIIHLEEATLARLCWTHCELGSVGS